jgi:hypothetical protein
MENDWKWYAGTDGENFTSGPFDDRDEAIAEATALFDYDGGFHIVEATKPAFPPPSADMIINEMFERAADDLFGDEYPEPCGTKEQQDAAEAELQAFLNGWMDKWRTEIFPTPWAFGKTRNGEFIDIERLES